MVFFEFVFIMNLLQELHADLWQSQNIRLFVKRDDLLHPVLTGNKYRKLKYNITAAKNEQCDTLVTVGGAFSNHIYAVAAAGKIYGFKTIGIIRGECVEPLNAVLQFAVQNGMELVFVSRSDYKDKTALQKIHAPPDSKKYWLPEGGTNNAAIRGCTEIIYELEKELPVIIDARQNLYICVSCGTGGTVTGILAAKNEKIKVIGFSALNGDFLKAEINVLLKNYLDNEHEGIGKNAPDILKDFTLCTNYVFGGYAKSTSELINFMEKFKTRFNIPLEYVYTGKMFFGIMDLLERRYFPENSTIVAIHTQSIQRKVAGSST